MSEFSKSPWEATNVIHYLRPPDENSRSIVDAHGRVIAVTVRDVGEIESLANAELIAAAPTMFEYIQKKADEGDVEAIGIVGNGPKRQTSPIWIMAIIWIVGMVLLLALNTVIPIDRWVSKLGAEFLSDSQPLVRHL